MVDGTYLQFCGALLFSVIFLFLWRQSGVVYFGYWCFAWALECAAWLCTLAEHWTGASLWFAGHTFFELWFALSLLAAGQASSGEPWAGWRRLRRFPFFLLASLALAGLVELGAGQSARARSVAGGIVLGGIYLYNFGKLRFGGRRRLFHFTLLVLSLLYLVRATAYAMDDGTGYLSYASYFDVAFKTMLAFSAMALWIESQNDRVAELGKELDQARRENSEEGRLDYLTGLLNQEALQRRMSSDRSFSGVAVVCDLDDFKSINDRFGHVVGDEVLRNVGSLLRGSIRAEDSAYRWGGDEFAILFNEQAERSARSRMLEIEARLQDFRVRGHGSQRIHFSWGVAEGNGANLRDVLETADREMYALKRERSRQIPPSPPLNYSRPTS